MAFHDSIRVRGEVEFFSYRTARVMDPSLTVPRDQLAELELELAESAKVKRDNHTVYGITGSDGEKLYIMFSDLTAAFGTSVKEANW